MSSMSNSARVLFFATLRDKAGVSSATLEFPVGAHISDIKALVLQQYPGLKQSMETVIVAVNHEFAFDTDEVPDQAEIAMFPPVSGGVDAPLSRQTIISIVDHEIDINQITAALATPTTGAVCIFTGTVRGQTSRGGLKQTQHLEYEAYEHMAAQKMRQISEEIRSRWIEVDGIALVQRIGILLPGVVSVVVACSSSHRDSGLFEATHYGINRLKEIVPIWKKEVSPDGEAWVEGEYIPHRGE
jgi:molybdopterin synthase catalytic subunit